MGLLSATNFISKHNFTMHNRKSNQSPDKRTIKFLWARGGLLLKLIFFTSKHSFNRILWSVLKCTRVYLTAYILGVAPLINK